jgi:hypothetical protein
VIMKNIADCRYSVVLAACLIGLLLNLEDGGSRFLHVSLNLYQATRRQIPEDIIIPFLNL